MRVLSKPSQSLGRTVEIQYSDQECNFWVREHETRVIRVGREMIEGLPKNQRLSECFFNACHVLCRQVEDGYRIYFHLSLKGGMLGRAGMDPINEIFSKPLGLLDNLKVSATKDEQLQLCRQLRQTFLSLISETEIRSQKQEKLIQQKQVELDGAVRKFNEASDMQKQAQSQLLTLKSKEAKLENTESDLIDHQRNLRRDMNRIATEIETYKRLEESPLGAVAALLAGLLNKHKDMTKRMRQTASELIDIQGQMRTAQHEYVQAEIALSQQTKLIKDLDAEKTAIDGEIKLKGQKLTEIKKVKQGLQEIIGKCRFLGIEVEEIQDAAAFNFFDSGEIESITQNLRLLPNLEVLKVT